MLLVNYLSCICCFHLLQGLHFEVVPSTFEENLDKSKFKHPYEYVLETAKGKALEVAERLKNDKVKNFSSIHNYFITTHVLINFRNEN